MILLVAVLTSTACAQLTPNRPGGGGWGDQPSDPGIRGGPPGAGKPFSAGLTPADLAFFNTYGVPAYSEI